MPEPKYIAYFDESGDHGMANIDASFPVFVLCGWVFRIEDYARQAAPAFSMLKFKHFGHDALVFHSREIRKQLGPFQIFAQRERREPFMADTADFFTACPGTLLAAAIDKVRHRTRYRNPIDPYGMALLFCLERLFALLRDRGEDQNTPVYCVFEQRGKTEDQNLANQFERICAGDNQLGRLPFRMVFASKQTNMPGLQMADLAAYPIARRVIDAAAPNAAWDAIHPKFRRSPQGKIEGWGLKVFP